MLERKLLSTAHSQRLCCPCRILDLPAIYVPLRQFLDLLRSDIRRRANLADESRPDLYLGLKGQLVEMQRDMDTRQEGLIECLDTIGGQEEDASIVLDMTQAKKTVKIAVEEREPTELTRQRPWHFVRDRGENVARGRRQPHRSGRWLSTS